MTFATTDPETAMTTTVGVVGDPEGDSLPSPPVEAAASTNKSEVSHVSGYFPNLKSLQKERKACLVTLV